VTPEPTTEILTHGSDRPRRFSRRGLTAVLVIGLAVAGGLVAALLRPTPPAPPFRLIDLQGVYAGMVRSDGQNDAAVIDPRRVAAEAETVTPDACEPLFEASVLNRPPPGALDGVGTFWALGPTGVSLFTYRFAGPAAAGREFARLAAAYGEKYTLEIKFEDTGSVVYELRPRLAFAWRESDYPESATRFSF